MGDGLKRAFAATHQLKDGLRIEVGKSYTNGWGATVKIVSGRGAWFEDENGHLYHPDGCLMTTTKSSPRFNLIAEL